MIKRWTTTLPRNSSLQDNAATDLLLPNSSKLAGELPAPPQIRIPPASMSDSHRDENSSQDASAAPGQGTDGQEKPAVVPADEPVRRVDVAPAEEPPAGRGFTRLAFTVLVILLVAGLALFATLIAMQVMNAGRNIEPPKILSGDSKDGRNDTGSEEPLSILPSEPGGVTILEKQAELEPAPPAIAAPVAAGAGVATGFAMDVGAADSFLELTRRFATIVEENGSSNFNRLEPRAVLRETINGLEARLLIGPFETEKEAGEACAVLILEAPNACVTAPFEGELISRQ